MQKSLLFIQILFFLTINISLTFAQNAYPYSTYKQNYIRTDKNRITFPANSSNFENLFSKLDTLILKGEGKIRIIHFGGSHIQAGIYSGEARKKMQNFFPGLNGGRGMIFPYGMSKTYTPKNYKIKWTGKWETYRNVEHKKTGDLGILGIQASTTDEDASITVRLNPAYQKYKTNSIKIFHDTGKDAYKIRLLADSSTYKTTEYINDGYTLIETYDYISEIKLQVQKTDTAQHKFTLYGINLEDNLSNGIVYTDAGISGASFVSFLKCNILEEQLSVLKPDLVIISIGTNDTYVKNFNPERYRKHYQKFIETIKRAVPHAAILMTVPNDCYFHKREPLKYTQDAENVILKLAKEQNCGVWNLYKIMGGYNSSYLWHKDKLMQNDLIHFTKKGYIIKGKLFFDALLGAYDEHLAKNK